MLLCACRHLLRWVGRKAQISTFYNKKSIRLNNNKSGNNFGVFNSSFASIKFFYQKRSPNTVLFRLEKQSCKNKSESSRESFLPGVSLLTLLGPGAIQGMQPLWAPCASEMQWASSPNPSGCRVPKPGGRWNYGKNTKGGDETAATRKICQQRWSPAPTELSGRFVTDISRRRLGPSPPNPEPLVIFGLHLLLIYKFNLWAKMASQMYWSNHSGLEHNWSSVSGRVWPWLITRTLTSGSNVSKSLDFQEANGPFTFLLAGIISLARYGLWFLTNGSVQRLEWIKQVKLMLTVSALAYPWLFLLLF